MLEWKLSQSTKRPMLLNSKTVRNTADAFIQSATDVTRSTSASEFFEALRAGYLRLHERLTQDSEGFGVLALREAFTRTKTDPAVRMALEMCAMPIYEKPILPAVVGTEPEFLWIFTLPIVIRFPQELCNEGPMVWPGNPLPAEEILAILGKSDRFDPRASLRMFTKLYTRSDILAWGPENLALNVLNAEVSDADCPVPLPVQFSQELSGYRSVMFLGLCAARVPVGVKALIRAQPSRDDLDHIEELIANQLQLLNIPFEDITVASPCPVTSSCFVSNPAFLQQVQDICLGSKDIWDLRSVYVKFPMPGYVEIVGRLPDGNEVTLMPAELCCEPRKEVSATLERVLQEAGLPVTGSFVSLHSRTANVH